MGLLRRLISYIEDFNPRIAELKQELRDLDRYDAAMKERHEREIAALEKQKAAWDQYQRRLKDHEGGA